MSNFLQNATGLAINRIFADAADLALRDYKPLTVDYVNLAYEVWHHWYVADCRQYFEDPEHELIETVKAAITLLCSNFKE